MSTVVQGREEVVGHRWHIFVCRIRKGRQRLLSSKVIVTMKILEIFLDLSIIIYRVTVVVPLVIKKDGRHQVVGVVSFDQFFFAQLDRLNHFQSQRFCRVVWT